MADRISFLGFELIVADLDRAVALFVDLFGFQLHERGASSLVTGDLAIVTDGRIAITLLKPTTEGTASILADRTPRFSQLILAVAPDDVDEMAGAFVEAGLGITPANHGFYVKPEAIAGALGIETAVVVTSDE